MAKSEDIKIEVDVVPASFSQERMWFLNELWPESGTYNVPAVLRLKGTIKRIALQEAVNAVIDRHESLRTSFEIEDGKIIQLIRGTRPIRVNEHDLTHLPETEREQAALELTDNLVCEPFSLSTDPLLRVSLIKLSSNVQLLVVTIHHIVADEWSLDILFREIADYLNSGSDRFRQSELTIQYADYADWQRKRYEEGSFDEQIQYWNDVFETQAPILELPTDRARPSIQTTKGAHLPIEFSEQLTSQLRQYARANNATPFIVMLAAYQVLLHRFSNQQDLVVGCPIANRNRPELEPLIGLFLNTVLVRTQIRPDTTFDSLVKEVRNASLNAFSNQDIPFERLVDELRPPRDPARSPLFQTMMTFQNAPFTAPDLPGCEVRRVEPDRGSARFDISLYIEDVNNKFSGELEYNVDLFDRQTIERLERHFQTLLHSIIESPSLPVSQLAIIPQQELLEQLHTFNDTQTKYSSTLIAETISDWAQTSPDKTALSCGENHITYGELIVRANSIAEYLQALGIGVGERVGICLQRSEEMAAWLLGILKSGAAYVPVDPNFPIDRQLHIVEDSEVKALVTQSDLTSIFDGYSGVIIDANSPIPAIGNQTVPLPTAPENSPAYVIYTSGSTGKPKGVVVPHSAMKNFLLSMSDSPGLNSDDRLLAITTLSFDISVLEIFLPLVCGATVVIATRDEAIDGRKLASLLEDANISIMQGTPASWQLLVDSGWSGKNNLKMLCGGEALSQELATDLISRGSELWNMYGPTETTVWSAVERVVSGSKNIPIGKPIANTQLYILSDALQPTPLGVSGNLYIGGDGLALGYHNREELTQEKFIPSPFAPNQQIYDTGDIACRHADSSIEFLGRRDNQVKLRGYRIELGEIEQALTTHDKISQAVVVAKSLAANSSVRTEKALVAYMLSEEHAPSTAELRDHVRRSLPDYMVPAHFVFLDEFPLTPNRKVDRLALPDPIIESNIGPSETLKSATDDIEQQLVNIWKSILGLGEVGIDQDFFDLGGHSLGAARMMVELEKLHGKRLPLALLLQAPTIQGLAKTIRERGWDPQWQSLVPINPGGNKNPLYCVHAAGGNVLLYRELAEHLGGDRPIYGLQSDALSGAIPRATTVQEMAAAYVAEIRNIQPNGPYNLCGYCLGGTIAYEMAQQLTGAGHKVGMVALFDTHGNWHHENSLLTNLRQDVQKIVFHAANLAISGRKGIHAFVNEKLREGWRRITRRTVSRWTKLTHRLGLRKEAPIEVLDSIYDNATEEYIPKPFSGRLTVFKPRKAYLGYEDEHLGWFDLVDDLQIIQLPVYPAGMLLEPFVAELAQHLLGELEDGVPDKSLALENG